MTGLRGGGIATADAYDESSSQHAVLHRSIDWHGAFWVASGVPALVLFSMGAVTATVGKPAWIVWVISITFAFLQAFTYAEIAGLFPHKSGGVSIHGAIAWARYSKFLAPVSVWCNWFAWSPVLAIGSGLAAGYILSELFEPDAVINRWQITLLDLGVIKSGLTLRVNATFILGVTILLGVFSIQHGGIRRSARITAIIGFTALVPLILVGLVPLLTGDTPVSNFVPLLPLAYDEMGNVANGRWDMSGWTLMAGGLFMAAWSTYGFETAVCYTREFRNPRTDTFKAIFYSGLLCVAVYTLVPIAFQGYFGLGEMISPAVIDSHGNVIAPANYNGMLAQEVYRGTGVAKIMTEMLGGGMIVSKILVIILILALLLAIMTSLAGSSRTLYQASVDGWMPRYLSYVNEHGAPTRAMWTDLCFNLVLLLMSDYVFVLAASNVGYIIFNFLNLNAGWIHRMDRPHWSRPYRAPTLLIALGAVLGFVNLALMGLGANVWGKGTLLTGLLFAVLVIPIFIYRHYIQDKGVFPKTMSQDMLAVSNGQQSGKGAGLWPYLTLVLGVLTVYITQRLAA